MKIRIVGLMLASLLFVSCGTLDIFKSSPNKSQDKLDRKSDEISQQERSLAKNNEIKLKQIGTVSKGVEHALDKEPEPSKNVDVAKELNIRVQSLASNPDVKDVVRIREIVDKLVSEVEKERLQGRTELKKLDNELQYSQTQRVLLQNELNKKMLEFKNLSDNIAEQNDKNEQTVDEMNKWFGLGAVFYGIKRFLVSSMIIIAVAAILFLILRVLATTNPIAGAIFSVFEMGVSTILKGVKTLAPGSFQFAKFVDKGTSRH